MRQTWKNGSHLEKMSDTLKNKSHFKKWVTLGKMGQSLKMDRTWKNGLHLEKWVTLGKMSDTWNCGERN